MARTCAGAIVTSAGRDFRIVVCLCSQAGLPGYQQTPPSLIQRFLMFRN